LKISEEKDESGDSKQSVEKYQTLAKEYLSLARELYSHQTNLSDLDQEKYQMTMDYLNSFGPNTKKKFMRRKKKKEEL
jgi:hypothetical protein